MRDKKHQAFIKSKAETSQNFYDHETDELYLKQFLYLFISSSYMLHQKTTTGNAAKPVEKSSAKKIVLPPVGQKMHWEKGTCLVIGDSLLNNLVEEKMGPKFKIRKHPGCVVNDLYYHVSPLLRKNPSSVIIMAGTNDSVSKTSGEIFNELLALKSYIEEELHGCTVFISCPTLRHDNPYAQLTINHLRKKLSSLSSDQVILNENINESHISKRGVHLNGKGAGRLAMNFMSHVRRKY